MIKALMLHFVKHEREAENFGSMPFASAEDVMDLISSLGARDLLATRTDFELEIANGFSEVSEKYVLTFDDGYLDHYRIFDQIQASFDVAMTFFVTGCTVFGEQLLVNKIQYFVIFFEGDWSRVNEMLNDFILKEALFTIEQMREFDDELNSDPSYDSYLVVRFKRYLQRMTPTKKAFQFLNHLEEFFFRSTVAKERRTLFWENLYMNKAQLQKMSERGAYIGYHSWSHRHLTNLSKQELRAEVTMPSWWSWSKMFCYPYGTYDDTVVQQIANSGYSAAFTVDHGICSFKSDIYKLPRVDIREALTAKNGG